MEKRNLESLNRVELAGTVGNRSIERVGDTCVARFSLATQLRYAAKDGTEVIETTWHNVTAWLSPGIKDFSLLRKGAAVRVTGRIRKARFTDSEGGERIFTEIYAQTLDIIGQTFTQIGDPDEADTIVIPQSL